ncbi:MAG: hypothetical protein QOJ45_2148 [Verrucomicrobiota bacterium]|jgi:hypothetical protein
MKRIIEWITKANQVLLFFFIIGATLLVSYLFYQRPQSYQPPSVPIAQTEVEAKKSVVQDVVFLGESSGVYALGLMKRVVTAEQSWSTRPTAYLGNEETAYPGQMVNVVFSRGDQPLKTLLQHDGLVVSHEVFAKHGSEKIKASLFRCVTEDTDGNHRLDENDRTDLYVISEALDRPDLVVKGVTEHRMISATHLVAKTIESKVIRFWDIDIQTQAKKEIAWK